MVIACCLVTGGGFAAAAPVWESTSEHIQISIWPEAAPDPQPLPGPEVMRTDDRELVGDRPDFAVPIYPGHLLLVANRIALNPIVENDISPRTPPMFLLRNEDDPSDRVEDALSYYMGLKKGGIPVALHAYAQGGHAFWLRESKFPTSGWPRLVEQWLGTIGMLRW